MKKIPIGIDDFKKIRENNYYYIDKTNFIEEIGKNTGKTLLFTRPRRFGKTLNMSMLKYFFDIKNKEENKKLFQNLYIEKSDFFEEQGAYPVVYISLKGIKADTWESSFFLIKSLISSIYNEFEYIREKLNESQLESFNKIWLKKDDGEYRNALKNLTSFLYEYYKKEVILLIDEYDSPLINAYEYGFYDEAVLFFKVFYGEALKTNPYLKMGIMTGIIRVIKAGIFSDLNNLKVYSILEKEYSDFYGFTQEEVEKALKNFNIEYELPEVKAWYDGYRFGNSDVYNPWSILNFIQSEELRPYWIETSGNFLINDILKNVSTETIEMLENLFNGINIEENINGNSDLSVLMREDEIWELLLFSGYLTIEEKVDQKNYILRLPNKEVKELFKDSFLEKYFGRGNKLSDLMEALTENRIEDYEESLQEILLTSVSYNDTKKGNEAFYHGLIMGMGLYLEGEYITKSNIESGLGRYDFLIEPKNKSKRAFIMEFKSTDSVEKLEEVSKEALKQIEDKKYDVSLKQNGINEITYIGIAFCGKEIKISFK